MSNALAFKNAYKDTKILMMLRFSINSKILSGIAISLWLCSLFMTVFSLYNGDKLPGYQILAMGWLSPLVLNFAWYANVFLIFTFIMLQLGRKATVSSIFAGIFSLDTIRYTDFLLNEGGTTSPIYGYGYGAVFWFLSICFMISAAGMRTQEDETNIKESKKYDKLFISGLILFVTILGSSVYFSIHDRMIANSSERTRLKEILFKRYGVCKVPAPMVAEPITNFSGVLRVIDYNENVHSRYPFSQISSLLSWGIPVVRFNNRDYTVYRDSEANELISTPATDEIPATLYVTEKKTQKVIPESIHAKLVDSSGKTVFDQTWTREPLTDTNAHYYCPDYKSFPGEGDQPRNLLVKALNISKEQQKGQDQKYKKERVNGEIIKLSEGGVTREMMDERWREAHPGIKIPMHEYLNTNCPNDIGWNDTGYETRWNTGRPFMVNEKAFYLPKSSFHRLYATCAGDFVYLYRGSSSNGKYYLNVHKRTIEDFDLRWSRIVIINKVPDKTHKNALRIESVKEDNEILTFELVNGKSGQVLIVQAPMSGELME